MVGRSGRKRKQGKRQDIQRDDVTPERAAHNDFVSIGMARRVVPVIDILLASKQITPEQYASLWYYRDQAHKAEDDMCDSGPLDAERIMGGGRGTIVAGPLPKIYWSPPAPNTRVGQMGVALLLVGRSVERIDEDEIVIGNRMGPPNVWRRAYNGTRAPHRMAGSVLLWDALAGVAGVATVARNGKNG